MPRIPTASLVIRAGVFMNWELFSVIVGYSFLISLVLFGLVVLCSLFCLVHVVRRRANEESGGTGADIEAEVLQPLRTEKGPTQPGKPAGP